MKPVSTVLLLAVANLAYAGGAPFAPGLYYRSDQDLIAYAKKAEDYRFHEEFELSGGRVCVIVCGQGSGVPVSQVYIYALRGAMHKSEDLGYRLVLSFSPPADAVSPKLGKDEIALVSYYRTRRNMDPVILRIPSALIFGDEAAPYLESLRSSGASVDSHPPIKRRVRSK